MSNDEGDAASAAAEEKKKRSSSRHRSRGKSVSSRKSTSSSRAKSVSSRHRDKSVSSTTSRHRDKSVSSRISKHSHHSHDKDKKKDDHHHHHHHHHHKKDKKDLDHHSSHHSHKDKDKKKKKKKKRSGDESSVASHRSKRSHKSSSHKSHKSSGSGGGKDLVDEHIVVIPDFDEGSVLEEVSDEEEEDDLSSIIDEEDEEFITDVLVVSRSRSHSFGRTREKLTVTRSPSKRGSSLDPSVEGGGERTLSMHSSTGLSSGVMAKMQEDFSEMRGEPPAPNDEPTKPASTGTAAAQESSSPRNADSGGAGAGNIDDSEQPKPKLLSGMSREASMIIPHDGDDDDDDDLMMLEEDPLAEEPPPPRPALPEEQPPPRPTQTAAGSATPITNQFLAERNKMAEGGGGGGGGNDNPFVGGTTKAAEESEDNVETSEDDEASNPFLDKKPAAANPFLGGGGGGDSSAPTSSPIGGGRGAYVGEVAPLAPHNLANNASSDDDEPGSNPFVKASEIKVVKREEIEGNPFMENEQTPYVTPKPEQRAKTLETVDMSVSERLKAGEILTAEEALTITVEHMRKTTEFLEEERSELLVKIKELEDMVEAQDSKINALEYYFRKMEETGELNDVVTMPYMVPGSNSERTPSASSGDVSMSFGRSNSSRRVTENAAPHRPAHNPATQDSVYASSAQLDLATDLDAPPRLSSSFQKAGEKMRRARAEPSGGGGGGGGGHDHYDHYDDYY